MTDLDPAPRLGLSLAGVLLCLLYGLARGGHGAAWRLIRSLRADLLLTVGVGIWANTLVLPLLVKFHKPIRAADPPLSGIACPATMVP